MKVKYIRFSEHAKEPEYAHDTDAGADLYTADGPDRFPPVATPMIYGGETVVFWTDIGIELPPGNVALVLPRSSWSKKGVRVSTGVIDAGYRGRIGITATNLNEQTVEVPRGTKLAQLVIVPVVRAEFVRVDGLSDSERGKGGYGSTDGRNT